MPENKYYLTTSGTFISEKELMHSNVKYIDLGPDEIMHWKYIKREKLPGGGWRYYYDDSYLKKEKSKADSARTDSLRETANAVNAGDDARRAMERSKNLYKSGDSKAQSKAAKDYFDAKKAESAAYYRAEKYSEVANKHLRKYSAMKVTAVAAKTLVKGLNAVSKLLSRFSSKKKR